MKKLLFITFIISIYATESSSYIGLGPLIPIIGSSIVFLFSFIVIILGFISYPLIKIYKAIKRKKGKNSLDNKKKENE
jgi:hypothetical protein|tara:strand:+ start:47 stop:280 length:234 start_codon:yes stop_codon:yes gene_type:complete